MTTFIDFTSLPDSEDDNDNILTQQQQQKERAQTIGECRPTAMNSPKSLPIYEPVKAKLNWFINTGKIPHIIFHGASGTGKITLVKDFIHRIYGYDRAKIKTNVMTVNCSHGKGIQFIREELKFFAKTNIQAKNGVEFKTILLLNAHHLTVDAQSALRRCIELFSSNTRFFIIVENKNKLLNPILSRFCEIYIPEHIDETGQIINLHQYNMRNTHTCPQYDTERATILDTIMRQCTDPVGNKLTTAEYMDMAVLLYEHGYSCLNIIDWFDSNKEQYNAVEYANMILLFHKIRAEFRCEKMLILFILMSKITRK